MKQASYLIVLLLLIFFFWEFPAFLPLRILVVFFHESSHAIATLITGGQVQEMVVVAREGGHVLSVGGNRFITLTAGYLGSLCWGIAIYGVAMATNWDRTVMLVLGVTIIAITLTFVGNFFAWGFGVATGIAMVMCSRFLSRQVNDFLLRLIGLTSMLYVVVDIYSDTIQRAELRSDARMLAEEFGGATSLWGWSWMAVSLITITLCFIWTLRQEHQM